MAIAPRSFVFRSIVVVVKIPRVPIPSEVSQSFTEIAQGTRLVWHMFSTWGDPAPASNFEQVNSLYPFEKVSDRSRHYVSAALEHINMWADFAAPFKFHPEQTTLFTLRPTMALARAALESAAQAVWLMDTRDPVECVRRHLCLIRWDLQEHRKSHLDRDGKERVKAREAALVERVSAVFTDDQIRPPASYLWVIQQACGPADLELEQDQAERLWRAMSGAAHGMYWTNVELTDIQVGDEYEPGHYRTMTLPDPDAMLDAMLAAYRMSQYAALKYLLHAGADIEDRYGPARRWLADNITLKPGADPEVRLRLAGEGDASQG